MKGWTTNWETNTLNWEDYDYLFWNGSRELWFNRPIKIGGNLTVEECDSKITVNLANSNVESIMI
jgi:hypothetical protein